jgi:adenylate cyclase
MALEIERKFLVCGEFPRRMPTFIAQGYLLDDPDRTVRVRVAGEQGFLTIKSRPEAGSFSRPEFEYEIPVHEAQELLEMCHSILEKTRYVHPVASGHFIEIDVFHGLNEGLIVAEVELTAEDEEFERPDWLGEDVTNDPRYLNSNLIKYGYK